LPCCDGSPERSAGAPRAGPGKARAPRQGDTPTDRYHNRVSTLGKSIEEVQEAFRRLAEVAGDDGRPLVDSRGVDARMCLAWREAIGKIDEELVVWGRTFQRAFGSTVRATAPRQSTDIATELDQFAGADDGRANPVDGWDRRDADNDLTA